MYTPEDLPCGEFLFARVWFHNQKTSDPSVPCVLYKHRERDKYSIHPYISHVTPREKDRYYRIAHIEEWYTIDETEICDEVEIDSLMDAIDLAVESLESGSDADLIPPKPKFSFSIGPLTISWT